MLLLLLVIAQRKARERRSGLASWFEETGFGPIVDARCKPTVLTAYCYSRCKILILEEVPWFLDLYTWVVGEGEINSVLEKKI
jgi:hypothetical protein